VDNVHYTSNKSDWETPPYVFNFLNSEFNFTLDAAASALNAKCERYFAIEDNALKQEWSGETVFVNPPYGRTATGLWIQKCAIEAFENDATVVMLIPARTDTIAWHKYAMQANEIRLIKGRIKFVGAKTGAPFPSAVIVFRNEPTTPKFSSLTIPKH